MLDLAVYHSGSSFSSRQAVMVGIPSSVALFTSIRWRCKEALLSPHQVLYELTRDLRGYSAFICSIHLQATVKTEQWLRPFENFVQMLGITFVKCRFTIKYA
ncbi:hypothetical protein SLA2020_026730 [Shorea laevis]